ncbi:MAG: hypothetical protein LQ342_004764 [Letrouitia transgressa]|nr:MAG: hypothetical protein LQ342_004764 [Letrouitia transgressa]
MANNVQTPSTTSRRDSEQPHVPRLAYRNACPIASISRNSLLTIETESSAATTSTATTSPQSSRFPASASSLDNGPDKCISSSTSSLAPKSPGPTKKKGSFLKFFTVKEPSTQAFEAYQERMRKRGTTQSGRVIAVGLPGVSSAKLPPTVPKVNSKWDGIPQAAKDKDNHRNSLARQSTSSSANRPIHTSKSTTSNITTSSTASDIRINGKLRYNNSSGNLSDIYGWEAAAPSSRSSAKSFLLEPPKTTSSSTAVTPLSDISSFFPPQPPSIPEAYSKSSTSASTPPPLEYGNNGPSPAQTLSEPSPITPNTPDVAWPLPMPLSRSSNAPDTIKTTTIDVPSQPANDQVLLSSSGIHILGPPASAKRRPKIDPTSEAQKVTLPPSPGIVDADFKFQPPPVVTSTVDHSQSAEWPLSSAPPPPPPEAGLMKRQNSARDRLKLGMTLRNNSTPGLGGGLDLDALEKSSSPTTPGGFKARAKNKLLSFNRGS